MPCYDITPSWRSLFLLLFFCCKEKRASGPLDISRLIWNSRKVSSMNKD